MHSQIHYPSIKCSRRKVYRSLPKRSLALWAPLHRLKQMNFAGLYRAQGLDIVHLYLYVLISGHNISLDSNFCSFNHNFRYRSINFFERYLFVYIIVSELKEMNHDQIIPVYLFVRLFIYFSFLTILQPSQKNCTLHIANIEFPF